MLVSKISTYGVSEVQMSYVQTWYMETKTPKKPISNRFITQYKFNHSIAPEGMSLPRKRKRKEGLGFLKEEVEM